MRCWKCGKSLKDGAELCNHCGVMQERIQPDTEEGAAFRKIYDLLGCEQVLKDETCLANAIGDMMPDAGRLGNVIRKAMEAGIGAIYLDQLSHSATGDGVFHEKVRKVLTDVVGLPMKEADRIILYFDEMIGWPEKTGGSNLAVGDQNQITVSGKCGPNAEWMLANHNLIFYGSGEINSYASKIAPWMVYLEENKEKYQIERIVIREGITGIGMFAFYGCHTKVIWLPDSLKVIRDNAFSNVSGLSRILIPDSVEAIGRHAFSGCTSLEVITFPQALKVIGRNAFEGCASLSGVYYKGTYSKWVEMNIVPDGNESLLSATLICKEENEEKKFTDTVTDDGGEENQESSYKGLAIGVLIIIVCIICIIMYHYS